MQGHLLSRSQIFCRQTEKTLNSDCRHGLLTSNYTPLFPSLSTVAAQPETMVSEVFSSSHATLGFFHSLSSTETLAFANLNMLIQSVQLDPNRDVISWELEASDKYSVKSAYAKLVRGPKVWFAKPLWATRVPLKIRIFLWQAD